MQDAQGRSQDHTAAAIPKQGAEAAGWDMVAHPQGLAANRELPIGTMWELDTRRLAWPQAAGGGRRYPPHDPRHTRKDARYQRRLEAGPRRPPSTAFSCVLGPPGCGSAASAVSTQPMGMGSSGHGGGRCPALSSQGTPWSRDSGTRFPDLIRETRLGEQETARPSAALSLWLRQIRGRGHLAGDGDGGTEVGWPVWGQLEGAGPTQMKPAEPGPLGPPVRWHLPRGLLPMPTCDAGPDHC